MKDFAPCASFLPENLLFKWLWIIFRNLKIQNDKHNPLKMFNYSLKNISLVLKCKLNQEMKMQFTTLKKKVQNNIES